MTQPQWKANTLLYTQEIILKKSYKLGSLIQQNSHLWAGRILVYGSVTKKGLGFTEGYRMPAVLIETKGL